MSIPPARSRRFGRLVSLRVDKYYLRAGAESRPAGTCGLNMPVESARVRIGNVSLDSAPILW